MPKPISEGTKLTIIGTNLGFDYKFEGPWSGRDIAIVSRMIDREYRLYQKTRRKKPTRTMPQASDVTTLTKE